MQAAVVTRFGETPRLAQIDLPAPRGPHEVVVDVVAAGLHPRVRSQADGSHYTSTGRLPLVPGIDGVGRLPDGALRYFVLDETTRGSMAEQAVVDLRRSVPLPEGCDPVAVAALMNPAMSSWIALRRRAAFRPGQDVLVLGATGSAGRLAVQVARLLGAGRVTAVGRDPERLAAAGADASVPLGGDPREVAEALGRAGADVDVVLDYVWGEPTRAAMIAIVPRRSDDARTLTWVQIGSVAGPDSAIPSAALRATRLQVVGSGQGSVPTRDIVAELGDLVREIADGRLTARAHAVPLRDVADAWARPASPDERLVLTPTA